MEEKVKREARSKGQRKENWEGAAEEVLHMGIGVRGKGGW